MKPKQYKIKTIQDILEAVDQENAGRFIEDFQFFLESYIAMKQAFPLQEIKSEFIWVDDGEKKVDVIIEKI